MTLSLYLNIQPMWFSSYYLLEPVGSKNSLKQKNKKIQKKKFPQK